MQSEGTSLETGNPFFLLHFFLCLMLVIFPLPSSHLPALPACLSPSLTTGDLSYGLLWLHQLTKTNPNGSGASQGKSESGVYFYPKRRIHPLINHWEYGVLSRLFFWLVHIHGGARKHKPAAGVHIKQTDGQRKLHSCQLLCNITVPALFCY